MASACGSALRVRSDLLQTLLSWFYHFQIISCDHSFLISPPFEVVEEMQVEAVGAPGKNESYSVEKHPDSLKRAPGLRLLFNCSQARPNSQNRHRRKRVFAVEVADAALLGSRENRFVFCKVRTFPSRMTPCSPHHST